jgi:hypothetical protein
VEVVAVLALLAFMAVSFSGFTPRMVAGDIPA